METMNYVEYIYFDSNNIQYNKNYIVRYYVPLVASFLSRVRPAILIVPPPAEFSKVNTNIVIIFNKTNYNFMLKTRTSSVFVRSFTAAPKKPNWSPSKTCISA